MATFSLDGSVLTATGSPDLLDYTDFNKLCRRILDEAEGSVVLDFVRVDSLPSIYLGAIFNLYRELQDQGRDAELRLSQSVRRVVEVAGLGRFIRLVG